MMRCAGLTAGHVALAAEAERSQMGVGEEMKGAVTGPTAPPQHSLSVFCRNRKTNNSLSSVFVAAVTISHGFSLLH